MKDKIKQWLDENLPERFISSTSEELAGKLEQCFKDLGLSNEWVSVEELEHVAQECSQQDWNDLRFRDVYLNGFIDGATYHGKPPSEAKS